MGRRLAAEAIHSLGDRSAWPRRLVQRTDGSLIPMLLFRFEELPEDETRLAAEEERISFPLQPLPSEQELRSSLAEYEAATAEARARGAGAAELCGLLFHEKWARKTLEDLRAGTMRESVDGSVHAVRIGDGVIITAPGEPFTEIGMAVKQRSPGRPTLYAGYTNGAVGYFPTPAAYPEGGYEPMYSNRSYGRPAPMAPGVRAAAGRARRAARRDAVPRARPVRRRRLDRERRAARPAARAAAQAGTGIVRAAAHRAPPRLERRRR